MSKQYTSLQDVETRQVMYDFLQSNDFDTSFHRMTASLVYALAYGKRFSSGDEEEVVEVGDLMRNIVEGMTPGKWMVEIFPILNYLPRPLAPWKRLGEALFRRQAKFFLDHFAKAQNVLSWNWCKRALDLKSLTSKISATELACTIGVLYEAGSDTTAASLNDFIAACLLHPEEARKAQEEIDSVIGLDRLPGFDDMAKIPYTMGFLQEVLRQRPITPVGIPHSPNQDDEYMGYHIPKGAVVLPNLWTMGTDEDVFYDADKFMPERWIENPKLPIATFGFGRRICSGRHIALSSIRIAATRTLWAYNVKHAYENGKRLEIDPLARTQDSVSKPSPFKVEFHIRSQEHREVVERSWTTAEKNLEVILDGVGPKSE